MDFKTSSSRTDSDYFELIHPSSLGSSDTQQQQQQQQLQLVVKRPLDRETISQHNLTIVACDGGQPSNCGQLRLVLNIGDINDNSPIFRRENYEFNVVENAPKGTIVGRIEAYDLDAGLNQKIHYKLVSSSVNDHFELDQLTGLITLTQPLDYEIDKQFSFKAEARDFGVGSLPAYTQIDVKVVDLNDNPPEISVSFLNSLERNASSPASLLVYLPENTESGRFIAHVSISDLDSPGAHSHISWNVLVNNIDSNHQKHLSLNKLNDNSFTIVTGNELDREFTPMVIIF